jgi:hypothetical protein
MRNGGAGVRADDQTPEEGQRHADQDDQGHEVEGENQNRINDGAQETQRKTRNQAADYKFPVGDKKDHEPPEEQEMVVAEPLGHHPLLGEGVQKHSPEAFEEFALEARVWLPQADQANQPKG